MQLSIIEDDDFWKKRLPVILSGDFNSDIQFEALNHV